MQLELKRIYEPSADTDGVRVLVDRLWPRGLSKDEVHVDAWLKEIAPSPDLRRWFNHDPAKWAEFQKRYRSELENNPAVDELRKLLPSHGRLTLLYGAKDHEHNHALVLKDFVAQHKGGGA